MAQGRDRRPPSPRGWCALAAGSFAALAAATAIAAGLDTVKLGELRSLCAEGAAVGAAQAAGRVNGPYARALRSDIRRDLTALLSEPTLGPLARQALDALDRDDTAALAALRDRLAQMEKAHGRAG